MFMSSVVESTAEIIGHIRELQPQLRALGVTRLALFGSFARGEQHANSDVDLLADFNPGQKTYDHFLAVCELLETALQRRVELLTRESLSPHIGQRILQEAEDVVAAD
jgi:uncharacterized protein